MTDARGGKLRTNTQEGMMPSSVGTGEGFEKRNSKLSVSLADHPRVRGLSATINACSGKRSSADMLVLRVGGQTARHEQ